MLTNNWNKNQSKKNFTNRVKIQAFPTVQSGLGGTPFFSEQVGPILGDKWYDLRLKFCELVNHYVSDFQFKFVIQIRSMEGIMVPAPWVGNKQS